MPGGSARRRLINGRADDLGYAGGIGEPRRLAVHGVTDVLLVGQDGSQRGGVGVDDAPVQTQQILVLEAGLEQGLQAALAAMQFGGALTHLALERGIAGGQQRLRQFELADIACHGVIPQHRPIRRQLGDAVDLGVA